MTAAEIKTYIRQFFKVVTGGPVSGPNGKTRSAGILASLDKLVDESERVFVPLSTSELNLDKQDLAGLALRPLLVQLANASGGTSSGAAPTITGFLPISGARGSTVVLTGTNFTGATMVSINSGAVGSFNVDSATQITAVLSNSQTTGKVRVATPGGTAVSASNFTVSSAVAAPTITSFTPSSAATGASITLTGTNLSGATSAAVNGTAATITANTATSLTLTVPAGATSGPLAVTTAGGTATSATTFTVSGSANPGAPTITALSVAGAVVGGSVTATGTNFGASQGSSTVMVNGTTATATAWSATSITFEVPAGATNGPVSVTTSAGTATSSTFYIYSGGTVKIAAGINSLTHGTGPTPWPTLIQAQFPPEWPPVANLAVNGASIDNAGTGAIAKTSDYQAAFDHTPGCINILIFLAGTNEFSLEGRTADEVLPIIKNWLLARRAEGWKILFVSCPPIGHNVNNPSVSTAANFQIQRYNQAAFADTFWDAYANLSNNPKSGRFGTDADPTTSANNPLWYSETDLVHPTQLVQQVDADIIADAVQELANGVPQPSAAVQATYPRATTRRGVPLPFEAATATHFRLLASTGSGGVLNTALPDSSIPFGQFQGVAWSENVVTDGPGLRGYFSCIFGNRPYDFLLFQPGNGTQPYAGYTQNGIGVYIGGAAVWQNGNVRQADPHAVAAQDEFAYEIYGSTDLNGNPQTPYALFYRNGNQIADTRNIAGMAPIQLPGRFSVISSDDGGLGYGDDEVGFHDCYELIA